MGQSWITVMSPSGWILYVIQGALKEELRICGALETSQSKAIEQHENGL